jgi:hypothetical protein
LKFTDYKVVESPVIGTALDFEDFLEGVNDGRYHTVRGENLKNVHVILISVAPSMALGKYLTVWGVPAQ